MRRLARAVPYGPDARHRLDVYGPKKPGKGALPVVVFFYGGSWSEGSRSHYGFAAHALAALGYVVAVPDYRLVPDAEYPAFMRDCARAVEWVSHNIAAHGGDWTRLVLAGHSAGAYNAATLALDPQWLPAATRATLAGVIGLSGPYDFYPFDSPISQRVFGQATDGAGTQPINHVDAAAPPMLLVAGGRDELVLPRNSERLGAAVQAAGQRATLRLYPRLGHAGTLLALSLPLRWLAPVRRDCRAFLGEVTRPARPDAPLRALDPSGAGRP
ncbi:alpha/beta hydrolase [Devosia salina]|uniref:Alpha/beta hydrolase n=1 Tax=Devosia salina TaxID=2860336 RepID=A0ABX8WEH7_9HYPH|nr:alpha/beta hydrolase [Devosia salina]QYO76381.1 alpha/beta hydrolase [Devosia salina]